MEFVWYNRRTTRLSGGYMKNDHQKLEAIINRASDKALALEICFKVTLAFLEQLRSEKEAHPVFPREPDHT